MKSTRLQALMFFIASISIAGASAQAQSLMVLSPGGKTPAPAVTAPNPGLPAPSATQASGPICASGRSGGAYEIACSQIGKFFADNQTGVNLRLETFGGSQANLDQLIANPAVYLAVVQRNDLMSRATQIGKDQLAKVATPLGEIGKECGYMLTSSSGSVGDLDDLADERGELYIVGNGANSIWRALVRTYPSELEKIRVITEQPGAAGKSLELADAVALVLDAGKTARAMFIVQLNNFSFSPDAKQMISQLEAEKLRLVAMDWRRFDDPISGFDGAPFTTEKGMLLKKGMFSRDVAVETVCTTSVVVYHPGKVAANPAVSQAMSKLKANPQVVKVEAAK